MNRKILFCWLGKADLEASSIADKESLGPIAQVASERSYEEIILLSNWSEEAAQKYIKWLYAQTTAPVTLLGSNLSSPTDFRGIYVAATEAISQKAKQYSQKVVPVFHLSPGTSAMAAVWILIAKTSRNAELIESSIIGGVKDVDIPFDISAELVPHILKRQDQDFQLLAAGVINTEPEFNDIIYRSEVMQSSVRKAHLLSRRSIPILIEGESGTGKELFARAIHDGSLRKGKPFVVINCGAVPENLIESELFGHEKGAFTGAVSSRAGHFETADGGSIFLDEVGELPKKAQVKLLRTLQEGEIMRVGSSNVKKLNIRVIAATNRSMLEEVSSGAFREDLFYRLAVGVIRLPALRDRKGDVGLLVDRLLEKINEHSKNEPGYMAKHITPSAKNILICHSWPGNVRELQNTLTRAAVLTDGDVLDEEAICEAMLPTTRKVEEEDRILGRDIGNGFSLPDVMKNIATHYLERGMQENNHNKSKAARALGLPSYQTLTNWLKRYGLE